MDSVCFTKTGIILETHSAWSSDPVQRSEHLNTLRQRAIESGYTEDAIDAQWMTKEEIDLLRDSDPGRIKQKEEQEALLSLKEIDFKSIRSIREYIAAQPDAPQYIKNYESDAQAERTKLNEK